MSPVREAQAWVELRSDDPEALSAFAVARSRLAAGRTLSSLRRVRLFELTGDLPGAEALARHLHASSQFYNPAKERMTLRTQPGDPSPRAPGDVALLVRERGGERRPAAERWWRHATGGRIEVREARVWLLGFEPDGPAAARAVPLAELRTRDRGLLCNPHVEACDLQAGEPPLRWIATRSRRTS